MTTVLESTERTQTAVVLILLFTAVTVFLESGIRTISSPLNLQRLANPERHIFLSRFDHAPWNTSNQTSVLPRQLHQNRVFVSSIPTSLSDGLGHRFSMINFEMLISAWLGIGYAHRVSTYGSITPAHDVHAVERLFGWEEGVDLRVRVLQTSCAKIDVVKDGCRSQTRNSVVCKKLTLRDRGGEFDHLVKIPPRIIDCFLTVKQWSVCRKNATSFMRKHDKPNTMFQMTPSKCHLDYRAGYYQETGDILRELYWGYHTKHGTTTMASTRRAVTNASSASRTLSLSPYRIQIAVHVRRGDFFTYKSRQLIPDTTYADMVCEIKSSIDRAMRRDTPVDVHIFSEGLARSGRFKDNHDVGAMEPIYVTETGKRAGPGHWDAMIANSCKRFRDPVRNVRTVMHIASDTVDALHDMIAADFFVGSASGMSTQIVQTYARGIVILPMMANADIAEGEKDRYLQFTYRTGDPTGIIRRDKMHGRVRAAVDRFKLHMVR